MRLILNICLLTCIVFHCTAQEKVRMLFAGDAMSHIVQVRWAQTPEGRDYSVCFREVRCYTENADYAVVNLETPLDSMPYSGYPRFSAPDEYLDALNDAGFDLFLLANNHIVDRGGKGALRTIKQLECRSLEYAGVYAGIEQRSCNYPYVKTFNNGADSLRVAFLNCTYGTNGLPVPEPLVVNIIDTACIHADIDEIRSQVDLCVMCVHWGVEYKTRSSLRQRQLAQWFADAGIDMIIGGHPHVVQEYEVLTANDGRSVPVFYSLGNMISNQRWRGSNGGIFVMVTADMASKKITDVGYLPVYVHKGIWKGERQYHLLPTINMIDTLERVSLPKADRDSMRVFHRQTTERLHNVRLISE